LEFKQKSTASFKLKRKLEMQFKERLASGECLIGEGIYSNSPELLEWAATGMDWIWWEIQHAHTDYQTTVNGVRAAYGLRIPLMIRSWTAGGDPLERLLDNGAEGIIVPMVDTLHQAKETVARCYYPPIGKRSIGSIRTERIEPNLNSWNKRIVVRLMIETPEGVENAESIASLDGVDGLLVGTSDLALRLGKYRDPFNAHAQVKMSWLT
jgi:4-hydroxy-2-oxoheptanedioate aldolase